MASGVDLEAELVAHLAALDGVTAAAVDVPHDLEERLPFVAVRLLPGQEWSRTWQGATAHVLQSVDIDLFTPRLEGIELGRTIRSSLSALSVRGVVPQRCPPLSRRPEYNERVRCVGAAFDFIVRV